MAPPARLERISNHERPLFLRWWWRFLHRNRFGLCRGCVRHLVALIVILVPPAGKILVAIVRQCCFGFHGPHHKKKSCQ